MINLLVIESSTVNKDESRCFIFSSIHTYLPFFAVVECSVILIRPSFIHRCAISRTFKQNIVHPVFRPKVSNVILQLENQHVLSVNLQSRTALCDDIRSRKPGQPNNLRRSLITIIITIVRKNKLYSRYSSTM